MILLSLLHHGINALHVIGDAELLLGAVVIHEADLPEDVSLCPALQSKDGHLWGKVKNSVSRGLFKSGGGSTEP